jgi:RNA polymerase sigma-70 factor (ECF subfamily)
MSATALKIRKNATQVEDSEIKALSKENMKWAVDLLVQKYRSRLYYHAICIVKDPQEAYDAVQEVFIKALREERFFNDDFQMKAWLFRVTSNLCFNIIRDKKRRRQLLHLREAEARPSAPQISSTKTVQQSQSRNAMNLALNKLTENHRRILQLRYYEDLSYNEIASVLEVKLGTVMSRLSRARSRLAQVLGPTHPMVLEFVT